MATSIRRPGEGPRDATAIYQATLELLLENGYDGLTIEGIAARSGVNKTTIYRWWSSKDELLATAFVRTRALKTAAPDTGSLRGDLLAVTTHVIELFGDPEGQRIVRAALNGLDRKSGLAEFVRQSTAEGLATEQPIFTRAIDRGELASDVDPATVIDMLAGAVWYRVFIRQIPLPPDFAERIVDIALAGLTPPA
ncbi:TetR/AcrR family transcriptional regulator [Asanoa sp. NPDC050611]|uniref:TetR/AcrR family transcriptional regulator n=1 Tax=Asanoa sp. NPDC050611 TaxID=3157098 RepID=UPI0033CFCD70